MISVNQTLFSFQTPFYVNETINNAGAMKLQTPVYHRALHFIGPIIKNTTKKIE